jgi:hypothetical protein
MRAMRNHFIVLALAFALAPPAGCGGGDGPSGEAYVGMYMVTSHRSNFGGPFPCTDAGAEVGMPPYIQLIVDPFFEDDRFLQLQDCTSADPGSCTDAFFTVEVASDGLLSENGSAQVGGGAACQLSAFRDEGSLNGTMLHLASFRWYEATDLSEPECTFERAEELLGGPMCEEVETWDATRI